MPIFTQTLPAIMHLINYLLILTVIFSILSCGNGNGTDTQETQNQNDTNVTNDLTLLESVDSAMAEDPAGRIVQKLRNHELDSCFLPEKSDCGGSVTGYYDNDSLVFIDSHFGAEFGYTERGVFFVGGEIYRIDYDEHLANFEAYKETYPEDETIFESKLTYSDNKIIFMYESDTTWGLAEKNKPELKKELMQCGLQMKSQLAKFENCR